MSGVTLSTFLPGVLTIARASAADYGALARFHYRPGRPATWAAVWSIHYAPAPGSGRGATRLVGVAVLSYPTVNSAARDRALGLGGLAPRARLGVVNAAVRTISRVVVHPQFRGAGLAGRLVRHVCEQCPTRWVEAFAVMGRVHPFFEKGGMTRASGADAGGPVYYLFDRGA